MKKTVITITVVAVIAAFVMACVACAPTRGEGGASANPTSSQDDKALDSLASYQQAYPLQTDSWLRTKPDGRTMGGMDERWHAFMSEMDQEGISIACGSCHMSHFSEYIAEHGADSIYDTDEDVDVEWMGCGVCHGSDLEAAPGAKTVYKDYITKDFEEIVGSDDAVCGQCHMIFPGTAYVDQQYRGINLYKYGVTAEGILKAYKESWQEKPVELTDVMKQKFFNVGVTYFDPEIGTTIYGWDNESVVEMFQGGMHENVMGLTCTDCHMPKTIAEDGTQYTNHFAAGSPLENADALAKCLTCHKAQGVNTPDEMVSFVRGKQAELSELQIKTHADLDELHELLAQATAEGGTDEAALEAARDAYTDAYFYYVFERANDSGLDDGAMAAHNFAESVRLLEKADDMTTEAIRLMKGKD